MMKSSARKSLWKISVLTSPAAEEAASELLSEVFAEATVAYHDFETGKTTVSIFLKDRAQFSRGKAELVQGLNRIRDCGLTLGALKLTCRKIRQEDWAESWKRHFKPIEIGRILLIKPGWSRRRPKKGQALVLLDPGLSFGTGHHPTTGFCLRELA